MPLAVRLPPEIEQRLRSLAARTGRSKASYAREAIVRYLEDLEDEQLALERLERPGRRWTQDQLERGLDSAGRGDSRFACFEEWASDIDTSGMPDLVGRTAQNEIKSCRFRIFRA
jgi:RHH-type transcriptional regulator, rel operon repressor / antitoxin RelB